MMRAVPRLGLLSRVLLNNPPRADPSSPSALTHAGLKHTKFVSQTNHCTWKHDSPSPHHKLQGKTHDWFLENVHKKNILPKLP